MDITKLLIKYGLTFNQIQEISSKLIPIFLKKGDIFIKYGEKTQRLGILFNGLLYAIYLSDDGQEWISRFFYFPNNFIVSSHECFFFDKNSSEKIIAYENSQLLSITKKDLEDLMKNNSQFERIVRILAEESYIQALNRIHALQSLTAEQRIKKFISEHKDLMTKVQRNYIASYLGIHRNILTRILNKL